MIGVAIYVRSKKWTGGPELRMKIRRDLEAGVSRTTIIEPAFVTEIEEEEDEGPSYVIVTKEGESILLTGQWLVWVKKRKFPWSKFEISEAPLSGHFFGVQQRGDPIPVSQKTAPLTHEQAKALGCFACKYIMLDDDAAYRTAQGVTIEHLACLAQLEFCNELVLCGPLAAQA